MCHGLRTCFRSWALLSLKILLGSILGAVLVNVSISFEKPDITCSVVILTFPTIETTD